MARLSIQVPKLGMDTTEALVGQWLVEEGDKILKGTALVELESEKVTFVVESEIEGRLFKILAISGTTVPVGETIAWAETE